MAILQGDIKLLASKVMDDVPEGGGGPTGNVIQDGASNQIFTDITESARVGGIVNIRQLFVGVLTPNRDAYMGANLIVAEPPADPNVSITIAKTTLFARRTAIAEAIANYLIRGAVWGGYLFENHVEGQRQIQLFQRPGSPVPTIGRTLVLVSNEGLFSEKVQYVRTTKVESETRTYYDEPSKLDYEAQIVTCELTDGLRSPFTGSPPSRNFTLKAGAAVVRDTTVADASNFFGVVPLSVAAHIGDTSIRGASIYTQLVPSSRTEAIALDQKPAAQRTLTLATAPRKVEIGVTPHSLRIRVGQENRGYNWTQMLRPRPAPGSIIISYRVLGEWYTLQDDGLGVLTGSGVGTVVYTTGSLAITLLALPDAGSSIIISWGELTAFTSRAGQAGYRAPEFAYAVGHQGIKPGSVTVQWLSGGVLKSVMDNGLGALTGDGTGEVNYAAGKIYLRPAHMIDAGGEFSTTYTYSSLTTQNIEVPALDAGGFATLVLAEAPAPRTVCVKWITVRNVSSTSGASEITKTASTGQQSVSVFTPPPEARTGVLVSSTDLLAGGTLTLSIRGDTTTWPAGNYTFEIDAADGTITAASFISGSMTGAFSVTHDGIATGSVDIGIAPGAGYAAFRVKVYNAALAFKGVSDAVTITQFPARLTDIPSTMPQAGIKVRNPISENTQVDSTGTTLVAGMYAGGTMASGSMLNVAVFPTYSQTYGWYYDPPADVSKAVWSAAELSAGAKTMRSLNGANLAYRLWGDSTLQISTNQPYGAAA